MSPSFNVKILNYIYIGLKKYDNHFRISDQYGHILQMPFHW